MLLMLTYNFNLATLADGGATLGADILGVIKSFLKSSFVRAGLYNKKHYALQYKQRQKRQNNLHDNELKLGKC